MLNLALNLILKEIIKQPRPEGELISRHCNQLSFYSFIGSDKDDDHGMPSNHAQFMLYFAVYASILFLKRYADSPR